MLATTPAVIRAEDPAPLAVLASTAGPQEKSHACLRLAACGDATAVPALAALLGDATLADFARTGLEGIADPAAADALRTASGKLEGRLLAGVINSLGVKRDVKCVGILQALVKDPAKGVAPEALAAMGCIATPEAQATIRQTLAGPAADLRLPAAHAALEAADILAAAGNPKDAAAMRAAVAKADLPGWLHALAITAAMPRQALFNGRNLDGWEGDATLFRVEQGTIVAGHLDRAIPRNEFLVSTKEYTDFELRAKILVVGGKGNGGIQLRSQRGGKGEMHGYQADAAADYWGGLYDEGRRNGFLGPRPAAADIAAMVDAGGWNEYVIRCEGPRIRLWLNGKPTCDFTEADPKIPRGGRIGLQIHGGPASQVRYKDIVITTLDPAEKN